MKTIKFLSSVLVVLIFIFNAILYSQTDNLGSFVSHDCPMTSTQSTLPIPYKPTNTGNNEFRVILVYVMFNNETQDPNNEIWPANTTTGPSYKGTMLAQQKNASGEWWNYYNPNTQSISS